MHRRKQIRYAIVNALKAAAISEIADGGSPATYRVFPNRPTPAFDDELPCIFVYTATQQSGSETATLESVPPVYKRELNVAIEIIAEADSKVDDTLDNIAEKVEQAIFKLQHKLQAGTIRVLNGAVDGSGNPVSVPVEETGLLNLSSVDVWLSDTGKKIVGSCKTTLQVPYWGALGVEDEDEDVVEKIHTTYTDTNGATAEDEHLLTGTPEPAPLQNLTFPAFSFISTAAGTAFINDETVSVTWGLNQVNSGRLVLGTDYTVIDHNKILLTAAWANTVQANSLGLLNINVRQL